MNCDILKSKLILCEWNAFYFIEIAFIGFTLDEIKQCIVFFWNTRYTKRHEDVHNNTAGPILFLLLSSLFLYYKLPLNYIH